MNETKMKQTTFGSSSNQMVVVSLAKIPYLNYTRGLYVRVTHIVSLVLTGSAARGPSLLPVGTK